MNKLEQKLAKLHHRKYCMLVGNGTTAIYLSLLSQGFSEKRIAIPNNVCMNVVLPIYFSNNIPVFIDIEKETLGLDLNTLPNQKVDGIIAVHAYGNICDIKNIQTFAKANNIFLIEDVAVAQGIFFEDKPLGSFGDVSILSFGAGKNINIHHGGAILTDSEDIYLEARKYLELLNNYSDNKQAQMDHIGTKHTALYNIDYGKSLNDHANDFKSLCINNKNAFLYKFRTSLLEKLETNLEQLPFYLNMRKKNQAYLYDKFKNVHGVTILEPKHDSSFWRFNIFVEGYRDELFRHLLSKKYKVSSWYHSVNILFEAKLSSNTPVSDWIGNNIINLWVNEEIDQNYLDDISNDIITFIGNKYG